MPQPAPLFAVNVEAADPLRLAEELDGLAGAGAAEFHVPVSDGRFAPCVRGGASLVRALADRGGLPVAAHLMVASPHGHVPAIVETGARTVYVHQEAGPRVHELLGRIREAGASPGVAVSPATPLTRLDYLLPLADRVLVLGAEPGAETTQFLPMTFDRVRILAEYLRSLRSTVQIFVVGGFGLDDAARLARMGAHGLVPGNLLFGLDAPPARALEAFRRDLAMRVHRV